MGRQHLAVSKSVLQVTAVMRPWLILLAVVLVTLEIAEGLPKPKWYLVDTEAGHAKGRADKGDGYEEVAKSKGEDYAGSELLNMVEMIVRKLLERLGPYGVELSPDKMTKVVDEAHKSLKEAIDDGETSMGMTTFTALKQNPAKLMEIMNDIQQETFFILVEDASGDYGND